MEFKLSDGPWQSLFYGKMQNHECEVMINPQGIVFAFVYEAGENGRKGVLAQCYKAFFAKGNLESFVATLPRKALMFERHTETETFKFLLLDSGTAYTVYEENAVIKETDELMARIMSFSSLVQEVSNAYDIDLTELENATEQEKMIFQTIPLLSMLGSPMVKRGGGTHTQMSGGHGEIMLGVTKKGTIVKEPLDFFDMTQVSGGEKGDRLHLLHVLIESALLSNVPAIVVDWKNVFSGLHFPNEDADELKKFKVETDALGFPIKFFKIGKELRAELAYIDPATFLAAFGLTGTVQGTIIATALELGNSADIQQLIDHVNEIPDGEHVTPFKKREAARVLLLIDNMYPELFTGKNPLKELSEGWVRGIGRANILLFEKKDMRKEILVLQSLTQGLLTTFRARGDTSGLRALFFLLDAEEIIPKFKSTEASAKIAADLASMRQFGLGFVVESEEKSNISKTVREKVDAELAIINRNDIGVIVKNRKNYRVLIRPGLSKCTERTVTAQPTATNQRVKWN